jgi:hypothetical protein
MAGLAGGAAACAAAVVACSDATRGLTGPAADPRHPGGGQGAITTVGYSTVVGDDWKAYSTKAQLQAAGLFWWVDAAGRNVYDYVDLWQDPTFGQVVRITFPQNTGSSGSSPRIAASFPAPLDKVWYRFRVKFQPGWTDVGPDPSGWANSYKLAFMDWSGYNGRMEIEYSNSTDYITGAAVQTGSGTWINYSSTPVSGSAANFGSETTEWSDGEWWEFVMYYDKTGPGSASTYYWRRRLTSGGQVVNNPWVLFGENLSGSATPQVDGIELGINKNKNNPTTMYLYWGPWEVVDGSKYANPFGMPNMGGTTPPPPTVTGFAVAPATVSLAPSATQQFTATETLSDGTTRAASATWTASGGTISTSGIYTAPAAAGTYSVIGHDANGMADTSSVTVSSSSPTLTGIALAPGSASVAPGGTVQFSATGTYSDGSSAAVTPAYTATGGSITSSGLYTAGQTAGSFQVVATLNGKADTSAVTITAPAPTLTSVVLTPATASVQTGGTVQFSATGTYSDGTSKAITPAYSATGGTITTSGLYTAGSTAGTFRVIASSGGRADTAAVSVTASSTPPSTGSYTRVVGDDWSGYSSTSALLASGYFSGGSGTGNVTLVSDATFGQVARITQYAGSTASPHLQKRFPAALDRMWFRFRVRFSPGWTTAGSGTNAAQWTMGQWTWNGFGGSGTLGFQNGSEYATDWSAKNSSNQYIQYTENLLPGSTPFGAVTSEWSAGGWWEYVVYWERTSATTARQHYWKRPLGGTWTYYGFTEDGNTTPQAAAILLGGDLGKAPAATQYVYWGPWEVVDGSQYANPFGMPGF